MSRSFLAIECICVSMNQSSIEYKCYIVLITKSNGKFYLCKWYDKNHFIDARIEIRESNWLLAKKKDNTKNKTRRRGHSMEHSSNYSIILIYYAIVYLYCIRLYIKRYTKLRKSWLIKEKLDTIPNELSIYS